jgi:hypothetical protein
MTLGRAGIPPIYICGAIDEQRFFANLADALRNSSVDTGGMQDIYGNAIATAITGVPDLLEGRWRQPKTRMHKGHVSAAVIPTWRHLSSPPREMPSFEPWPHNE